MILRPYSRLATTAATGAIGAAAGALAAELPIGVLPAAIVGAAVGARFGYKTFSVLRNQLDPYLRLYRIVDGHRAVPRRIPFLKEGQRTHVDVTHKGQTIPIHYIEGGKEHTEKGTLLLLHGLGSHSYEWNLIFDELADQHHVIAMDLPGHGYSSCMANYDFLDDLCPVVEAFMHQKGLKKVTLFGSSMGGLVAQLVAAKNPERVNGLLLLCSVGCTGKSEKVPLFVHAMSLADRLPQPPRFMAGLQERAGTFLTLNLFVHPSSWTRKWKDVTSFAQPIVRDPRKVSARARCARQVIELSRQVESQRPYIELQRSIQQRTWIVDVDADPIIPLSVSAALRGMIPRSRLIILDYRNVPRAGHTPMSSKPKQTLALIAAFLRGVEVNPILS